MLYLDDFLEMLEELPSEIRERCNELRVIDQQVSVDLERAQRAVNDFFMVGDSMSEDQKKDRFYRLQQEYARIRGRAEEKVTIAEKMQELVEKYVTHFDREKLHFKCELEADNPGVTEGIEKRFADYIESVIALRKERKRRSHSMNGNEERVVAAIAAATAAVAHAANGTSSSTGSSTPTSVPPIKIPRLDTLAQSRPDYSIFDDEVEALALMRETPQVPSPMSVASSIGGRTRRTTLIEEGVSKKRSAMSSNLKMGSALSPAVSEKSYDRWTPTSSRASPSPSCSLAGPPGGLTPSGPPSSHALKGPPYFGAPSSSGPGYGSPHPMPPSYSGTTPMPNFTGAESRHGRPRKLTTRVQEMFSERMQRQERSHRNTAHTSTHEGSVTGSGSENEEEEEGEDHRTWCFCSEKSYGEMVACDNKQCPYEWFHFPCVGLTVHPKGKWFCPHCTNQLSLGAFDPPI